MCTHGALRVLFGGKTHAFEVSQPRYLENPLATGRVSQTTAKSSSLCRTYAFFLLEERKGELCAVVRINPACSALSSAEWRAWQVPWAVHALCLPELLGSPSPAAPHSPLSPLQVDSLSLRNTPLSGNGIAASQALLHPRLSDPASTGRQGRAQLLAC